jgi:hypothetical protein
MNRRTERRIIVGYWILALAMTGFGVWTKDLWFAGGGAFMFMYLLWFDRNTVEDLVARDDLKRSIKDLEQVIREIEEEGDNAD